jgi:hypothetical protein
MLTFKYRHSYPPDGIFAYIVPETGMAFDATRLEVLVNQVSEHYVANKLAVPQNLEAIIIDYVCRRMPTGACIGVPEPGLPVFKTLSVSQIRDFSKLLYYRVTSAVRNEDPYVKLGEAARRAAICAACPLNLKSVCSTCDGLKEFGGRFLFDPDKQTTPHDAELKVCTICGCLLRAKVHYSLEALAKAVTPHDYPIWCWLGGSGRMPTQMEIQEHERRNQR